MITEKQKVDEMVQRHLNGESYNSIAKVLDCDPHTVSHHVRRILYNNANIFNAYADIWRGYMENGQDMTEDDKQVAYKRVADKMKLTVDQVGIVLSRHMSKELESYPLQPAYAM